MKKYYGYMIYDEKEYVIRFKIDGSLAWNPKEKCFIDNRMYVRTAMDMISLAANDTHPLNDKHFHFGMLLTHEQFVNYRAKGIERWKPKREIIQWS